MGKDYVYAVVPLLEDALMDRDAVHRQTAAVTVKRMFRFCLHPFLLSFSFFFFIDSLYSLVFL